MAVAVGATDLILLTNVPGLLLGRPRPLVGDPDGGPGSREAGRAYATGRMRKKVVAAEEALAGGVGRVVIAPSSVPLPVTRALAGEGTEFR